MGSLKETLKTWFKIGSVFAASSAIIALGSRYQPNLMEYLKSKSIPIPAQKEQEKILQRPLSTNYANLFPLPQRVVVYAAGHRGEKKEGGYHKEYGRKWGGLRKVLVNEVNESELTGRIVDYLVGLSKKNSPGTYVFSVVGPKDKMEKPAKASRAKRELEKFQPYESIFVEVHVDDRKNDSYGGAFVIYSQKATGNRSLEEVTDDLWKNAVNRVKGHSSNGVTSLLNNSKLTNVNGYANSILNELQKLGFQNRGICADIKCTEHRNLYFLENIPAGYPAILIEIGNIENQWERDFIINNPDKIAEAIYKGICNYYPTK